MSAPQPSNIPPSDSPLAVRLARRLDGWPSLHGRDVATRLEARRDFGLAGARALAGEVAQRFETGPPQQSWGEPLSLPPIVVPGQFRAASALAQPAPTGAVPVIAAPDVGADPVAVRVPSAATSSAVAESGPGPERVAEPESVGPPAAAVSPAAPAVRSPVGKLSPALPLARSPESAREAGPVQEHEAAAGQSQPAAAPGSPTVADTSPLSAEVPVAPDASVTGGLGTSLLPLAPQASLDARPVTSASADAQPGIPGGTPPAVRTTVPAAPVPPGISGGSPPAVATTVPAAPAGPLPLPAVSRLAGAVLQRSMLATAGTSLGSASARGARWSPVLRRGGPDAVGGRHLEAAVVPLVVSPSASRRPQPFETARFQTAPFETAPFETAPFETAPFEAAPPRLLVAPAVPAPARESGGARLYFLPVGPQLPVARAALPSAAVLTPAPAAPSAVTATAAPPAPGFAASAPSAFAAGYQAAASELVLASPPAAAAASQQERQQPPGGPSPPTLPTVEAAPSAPPVDTGRIADQVYDLLVVRLGHERARRGW